LPATALLPPAPIGAELTGAEVTLEGPPARVAAFTEALMSWNLILPPGTGVRCEIRVGREREGEPSAIEWTPWLFVGTAGDVPLPRASVQSFTFDDGTRAKVEIDAVVLSAPAQHVQWRVAAVRGRFVAGLSGAVDHGLGSPVVLSRLALCTTREEGDVAIPAAVAIDPAAVRELAVPFRSQVTEDPRIAGRVCSPTSVAMALAFARARSADPEVPPPSDPGRPVMDVCTRAYDAHFDLFGNWPRNIQAAFELGEPGWLMRISDWPEAHAFIARGIPLIASIRAKPGELRGAPYDGTDGHLIVIVGFTREGDAIVLDPAVETAGRARRIYRHEDLERVWFEGSAGTTYVIGL